MSKRVKSDRTRAGRVIEQTTPGAAGAGLLFRERLIFSASHTTSRARPLATRTAAMVASLLALPARVGFCAVAERSASRRSMRSSAASAGSTARSPAVVSSRRRRSRYAHVVHAGDANASTDADAANQVANMDALIDLLVAADERRSSSSWRRTCWSHQEDVDKIAPRSDAAESQDEKDALMSLAGKCMKLIETMVQKTENTIQASSKSLENIVAVAADPDTGEFDVPLTRRAAARMRDAVNETEMDEQMLNTVYAWIRKSDEDKLDGMVHILQHLLQCYAARENSTPGQRR